MKSPREYYPKNPIVYTFELDNCLECKKPMNIAYTSKAKAVQTMGGVMTIASRLRHCLNQKCGRYKAICQSAQWQQVAPRYCTPMAMM